mgnify:CR=1 FL=1
MLSVVRKDKIKIKPTSCYKISNSSLILHGVDNKYGPGDIQGLGNKYHQFARIRVH